MGQTKPLPSRSYNIGGPEALSLLEITQIACATAGQPEPTLRPFPAERASIDIGSYRTDFSRIRAELGWEPKIQFMEGFARALGHYRRQAAAR